MENTDYTINTGLIKMPKNIRQIGSIRDHNKAIYVEDYVMTYIKQLSVRDYTACKVAVLLGYYVCTEESKNLFIKGAIEMKSLDINSSLPFSDEAWTSIYENIKKYFIDVEIVGWALIGPEFFLENEDKIKKIHTDNFFGPDKTLLKMDSIEKEEAFYLYENNQLIKQSGYYIYYEKNEEMQNYMVENKEVVIEERSYVDETTRKIRKVIKEKKEPKDDKNVIHLLYGASALLTIIVLIIAAAMLNNYGQLKNMETAINTLSEMISSDTIQKTDALNSDDVQDPIKTTDNDTAETDNNTEVSSNQGTTDSNTADANQEAEETMEVETVPGNITADSNTDSEKGKSTDDASDIENAEASKDNIEDKESNTGDTDTTKGDSTTNEATIDNGDSTAKDNSDDKAASTTKDTTTAKDNITDAPKDTTKSETVEDDSKQQDTSKDSKETVAETKYYTVKAGESLAGISYRLYNSYNYISTIKKLNGIEDENKIFAGQKLIVP